MYKLHIILAALIASVRLFRQDEYKLKYQRIEAPTFNSKYVKNLRVSNFKFNRTTTLSNGTFTYLSDLNNNIDVVVQAYKFLSNEYRLFPLRFLFDFCVTATKNDFGLGRFYSCGNFTKCPVKKGTYIICNWNPDASRFPPLLPSGDYMFELNISTYSEPVMTLRVYGTIYRPSNLERPN